MLWLCNITIGHVIGNKTMRKPPLIALILAIAGVAVLCFLGLWQVKRLAWKTDLQTSLDRAYEDSQHLPILSARDIEGNDFVFKRGIIEGRYVDGHNILITPRTYDGDIGHHYYSAFRMNDGAIVFVNRGWIPQNFDDLPAPSSKETLIGLFKKPPRENYFTPPNDIAGGQWYHPDLDDMKAILQIDRDRAITDYLFILQDDGRDTAFPASDAIQVELRNQHLQYAVFWFMMAFILMGVFFFRFMRVK